MPSSASITLLAHLEDFYGLSVIYLPNPLLGTTRRVFMQGTMNMHAFEGVAEPWREEYHLLVVPRDIYRSLWISGTRMLDLRFTISQTVPKPQLPDSLLQALKDNPDYQAAFHSMTESDQWQYICWITNAPSHGVQESRIEKTLQHIRRLLNLPYASNTLPSYLKAPIPPNLQN